jgi:CRP/FNR family transcriptional regulator, cyclic AMP receptor protein
LIERDLFGKPLHTFPDHALVSNGLKAALVMRFRSADDRYSSAGAPQVTHRIPEILLPQDKIGEAREIPVNKLTVLRRHPIFCDLDSKAFEQLGRYAKHATLKRGATIFSKGDPGNSLVAVISGTVKISISSADGRSAILNLIGPGEVFGEVAVLDGQARTADAIANTNCEIFVIDRREFLPFVRSQPALAMKIIELLCTRLRWTSDQVEEVILQDLPGRLASALIRLTERHQTKGERTIAVTQQEISEMVGMTRESINKQLRSWAARNWVRLEHGAIVVLDRQALAALAGVRTEDN